MKSKPMVIGFTGAGPGGAWLRVQQPLDVMGRNGYDTVFIPKGANGDNIQHWLEVAYDHFMDGQPTVLFGAHGIGWSGASAIISYSQETGIPFVVDADDAPGNISPFNPAYVQYGTEEILVEEDGKEMELWKDGVDGFNLAENRERMKSYRTALGQASLITTTTQYLADIMIEYSGNPRSAIIPNFLDFEKYWIHKPLKYDDGNVRILYMGGSSHFADLKVIRRVFPVIAEKFPNVKFVFMGDVGYQAKKFLPADRVEVHDWEREYGAFTQKFAMLGADIGVAPLNMGKNFVDFNRSKSAIKWLDYAALSIPIVATRDLPYFGAIDFGDDPELCNGILAKTETDWLHWLALLITNPKLRNIIGNNARMTAITDHNAADKADFYASVFLQAWNNHQEMKEK